MALHAEALDPGHSEQLSLVFRFGIEVGKMNRPISLAYKYAIPTDRVRVLMEADTTVAEQGKGLKRDDTGLRHGTRQGGPAATIEVLIRENNACVGPTDADNLTKCFREVLSKHSRRCLIP